MACGIVPNLLVGDFDSVSGLMLNDERLLHVRRIEYPSKKAHSDLDLALQSLLLEDIQKVTIVGASGGRTDHMLFNWMLPLSSRWPFAIKLIDNTVVAHVVTAAHTLECSAQFNQLVSLIALCDAHGVTTKGLEYPLTNASIQAGSTLGLSNVVNEPAVQISLSTGVVLALLVHNEKT